MVTVLFAIIAIAIIGISIASYARTETVTGILVTNVPSVKIGAGLPGVVEQLHVHEGKYVRKGARLAVISLDRRSESGELVKGRAIGALQLRKTLAKQQLELSEEYAASEQARLLSVALAAEEQIESLKTQIQLQEEVIASNQKLFDQMAEVVERGFVSKVEFERRRQLLIAAKQSLTSLYQQQSAQAAEANQARTQVRTIYTQLKQNNTEITSSLHGFSQQEVQLEGEQSYILVAPISGRVAALQTAVGRAVSTAIPLMVVVPERSQLSAELYAPTKAIGFVKKGQEVRILLDAFPYQRFGSFPGKILNVSQIIIDPREAEVPIKLDEAVYRITVKLDTQQVMAYGETHQLYPGMTLRANIILERHSFLSWLLKPLNAVLKRSA
jgi:membrane fusion protein